MKRYLIIIFLIVQVNVSIGQKSVYNTSYQKKYDIEYLIENYRNPDVDFWDWLKSKIDSIRLDTIINDGSCVNLYNISNSIGKIDTFSHCSYYFTAYYRLQDTIFNQVTFHISSGTEINHRRFGIWDISSLEFGLIPFNWEWYMHGPDMFIFDNACLFSMDISDEELIKNLKFDTLYSFVTTSFHYTLKDTVLTIFLKCNREVNGSCNCELKTIDNKLHIIARTDEIEMYLKGIRLNVYYRELRKLYNR